MGGDHGLGVRSNPALITFNRKSVQQGGHLVVEGLRTRGISSID